MNTKTAAFSFVTFSHRRIAMRSYDMTHFFEKNAHVSDNSIVWWRLEAFDCFTPPPFRSTSLETAPSK